MPSLQPVLFVLQIVSLGLLPIRHAPVHAAPTEGKRLVSASTLPSAAQERPEPPLISLELGEIRSIPVDEISRVAIGDPAVADVTIVSWNEILLQATAAGTTNLILWDRQGQHVSNVKVVDRALEEIERQLRQRLIDLGLSGVKVSREPAALFLTGEVPRQEDVDRLEQLLAAYEDERLTNLVTAAAEPPAPPARPLPSVKLTVQLIEMSRNDKDQLGVDWADSLTFTETTFGALGPSNVSPAARLGEAFRFGALSRSGLTPTLNMLVSKGKARILAEPKLVAASGKSATTTLGVEVPIITTTSVSAGTVSQNIEFKQTGVELKFQPTVLDDGRSIQLAVTAKVSSIDTTNAITVSGILVPGFKVRETQTEIVTKSGEVVMIAGLLQEEEKKNLGQLPGLGSIPVLGNLFRSTSFTRDNTELIIIVIPELTEEPEMPTDRSLAVDQALANAEVVTTVTDPTLQYALEVQQRIARAIRYPALEDAPELAQVKLRLHLFRDGRLVAVTVSEPSGYEAFDLEALRVAESQTPYPPFPDGLVQPDLWFELPIVFRP